MSEQTLDTFMCVHQRDVGYLLELVLRSYQLNFLPKNNMTMVTNDVPHLQAFLERMGWEKQVTVTNDNEWLSKEEAQLPGWFRQQLIKLRAYKFCKTENFCNLGADTVLLQPIHLEDLVYDGRPISYYTRHMLPDNHYRYEKERIGHVANFLQIQAVRAYKYVDFINDLFCFNRENLMSLDAYMEGLYGENPYGKLLSGMEDSTKNRNKFGEWTLYSVYVLDKLNQPVMMRNTRQGFLHQVHSNLSLRTYRFNTKVVHFVGKNFDLNYIYRQIGKHTPELANAM